MIAIYKEAWECMYGKKSHMNLAGKIILGVPLFPVMFALVTMFAVLETLFAKHD